jgi:hypothetical protein
LDAVSEALEDFSWAALGQARARGNDVALFDGTRWPAYLPTVATGWDEFLNELKSAPEGSSVREHGRIWDRFAELWRAYGRPPNALEIYKDWSPQQRTVLAFHLASERQAFDWPLEWVPLRKKLVSQLDRLLDEMKPSDKTGLTALLQLEPGELALVDAAWSTLTITTRLLAGSCPRYEIPELAALVNVQLHNVFAAYRRAIGRQSHMAPVTSLHDARTRFMVAFSLYTHAASDLNSAMGRAVFAHLELRLQGPDST